MTGQVTIPTDMDVINETLEIMKKWGADAIRDCDGTEFPIELKKAGAKIYNTYYTTRKDNTWAKANPDEVQQMYIMSGFHTADGPNLEIHLLAGISPDLILVNDRDDITRWWEVIDRTTGDIVPPSAWQYNSNTGRVTISNPARYHEYTVSFLAYIIWDPVHMYNAVTNSWQDFERQITFDVRQPKTKAYSMDRLRAFLTENPHVDVVRFTTFFHQFTLIFDELRRQKYVDWYGYSASVSPYILEQFEKEAGYPFRAEYIIDQGYYNNQYRIPSKEYRDFMAFQRREVAALAKEMVDITHEFGKEAMMFLGDHFIGADPWMDEFETIGIDAVVGSVGNGATLRLISDIKGVNYTEGRFLPYFFPDVFKEGGDPVKEATENWITARRAILRKPIDRIGYGGYLKLALQFPEFVDYVEQVCNEFRALYKNIKGGKPYSCAKVAVLNCWGKARAWGNHMVHHALYQKQNYSYFGVIEALAGGPYDVSFISFEDILENPDILEGIDVIINTGEADTAHTGGEYWAREEIITTIRGFIAKGGGFIGIGEPSGHQHNGRFFQLAGALGVEKETGFTLGYDKYNWEQLPHFITEDITHWDIFGEGSKNIYALEETQILYHRDKEVQLAANQYFNGRCVYMGGMAYSPAAARMLYRAVLWACNKEDNLKKWFSTNPNIEVHYYPESGNCAVCNNSYEPQSTTVYRDGNSTEITLAGGEMSWIATSVVANPT
ncbi:MAG: 1,3-beta-galactosyl-N-acetylhexosamine phosphorylase [Defluviitaleaceae bacterium]|nr:1,3-beta-galactosyl-N-acetylhexosamine phosphorylase [Defluviitaleaceae bacterium]